MEHHPDPEFVDHLEWQLARALRRRERFARPVTGGHWHAVRMVLLVAVSLLGGAGAVVAAERIQDSRDRELLAAQAQVELDMALAELEHARRQLEYSARLHERAFLSSREMREDESNVARHQRVVDSRRLDLTEIQLSGTAPRRELSAPLVRGRDFVMEHLQLDSADLENEVQHASARLAETRALADSGYVSHTDLFPDEKALDEARSALAILERRMGIRSGFLRGEYRSADVALLDREATIELEIDKIERQMQRMDQKLRLAVLREQNGIASRESDPIRLDLELLQGTVKFLQLELERVRGQLGR